jgi:hypothetical protein
VLELAINVHKGHSSLLTFLFHNYLETLDSFIISDLRDRGDLMDEDKEKRKEITRTLLFGKTNELGDNMKLAQPLDR